MSDRDCNKCLYATRDGGCASWGCNYISIAEAEPKRGHWTDGENMNGKKFLPGFKYCSVCHKEAYWDSERGQQLFPCCPYCGARME